MNCTTLLKKEAKKTTCRSRTAKKADTVDATVAEAPVKEAPAVDTEENKEATE